MEKRVTAARLQWMVRGFRKPSISSTLDDRRPADRSISYHIPAATANLFRGPCPKSQPVGFGPAIAVMTRIRERSRTFFCDSWDCDSEMIWSKPTTMTTGRFWPPGSFFFEARTTVQKANGLHIGKAQRRRFAIADRFERSPRFREQDRSPNEAFSGTRGVSTNGPHSTGGDGWTFHGKTGYRRSVAMDGSWVP
jgi:hypothetical protein